MIHTIRLLRLPNLFVMTATVCIIQIYLEDASTSTLQFSLPLASIISLIISMIAGAGYAHNDLKDQLADEINNPQTRMIGHKVTESSARKLIWGLVAVAVILAVITCIYYRLIWPIPTALVVVLVLYLYNAYGQGIPLLGNIMIAALCAYVVWLPVQVADSLGDLTLLPAGTTDWIVCYVGLAFAVTLYREIIKDLEDLPGDRQVGQHTLPVVVGEAQARVIAGIWLAIIFAAVMYLVGILLSAGNGLHGMYLICFILVPMGIAWIYGWRARTAFEYAKASMWTKHAMFMALLFLLLLVYVPL